MRKKINNTKKKLFYKEKKASNEAFFIALLKRCFLERRLISAESLAEMERPEYTSVDLDGGCAAASELGVKN